jgi:aminocarboxymuconate-semialdehyde decarboxylase
VAPSKYLGKFWVDSLVHDPNVFHFLMNVMGVDKICLGSDYPFPLGEHVPGELIEQLKLEKGISEKLLYRNALEWLRLGD